MEVLTTAVVVEENVVGDEDEEEVEDQKIVKDAVKDEEAAVDADDLDLVVIGRTCEAVAVAWERSERKMVDEEAESCLEVHLEEDEAEDHWDQ